MIGRDRVKFIIEKRKTTVKKVATNIGISPEQLHRIMTDGKTKFSTLKAIATELNVPVEYLNPEFDLPEEWQEKKASNMKHHVDDSDCEKQLAFAKREIEYLKHIVDMYKKSNS